MDEGQNSFDYRRKRWNRKGHSVGAGPRPMQIISGLLSASPEKGAQTSVYLATSAEVQGVIGQYFEKCKPGTSMDNNYMNMDKY